MYTVTNKCKQEVLAHTMQHLPFESCGVITAHIQSPLLLDTFHPIRNSHQSPRHFFEFNKQDWLNVNLQLAMTNRHITCYVHSHINALPTLSKNDLVSITDFDALQMIVHYNKKNSPTIHVYRYNKANHVFEYCPLMFT